MVPDRGWPRPFLHQLWADLQVFKKLSCADMEDRCPRRGSAVDAPVEDQDIDSWPAQGAGQGEPRGSSPHDYDVASLRKHLQRSALFWAGSATDAVFSCAASCTRKRMSNKLNTR